ncbi:hypothetical protein MYX19_01625 [Nitrospinae bacterium AH-259-F20]|nr:hypothetical protein [Nitrospinae bacterium AH-259-F20]
MPSLLAPIPPRYKFWSNGNHLLVGRDDDFPRGWNWKQSSEEPVPEVRLEPFLDGFVDAQCGLPVAGHDAAVRHKEADAHPNPGGSGFYECNPDVEKREMLRIDGIISHSSLWLRNHPLRMYNDEKRNSPLQAISPVEADELLEGARGASDAEPSWSRSHYVKGG